MPRPLRLHTMRGSLLALALTLGCDRTAAHETSAVGTASVAVLRAPAPKSSESATSPRVSPHEIEIRACAPLEEGELRLLDVDSHTAARLVAIARRTPVVAAGRPARGCLGRCRDVTLSGPADADLAAIGFEVTRADGLLLAGPAKVPVRRLLDGGPKIDIERERASLSEVALLLAGKERIDRAVASALAGEVTIVARNVSGDRLLDAAAALAGGRLRASSKRVVLEAVRGLPAVGRLELSDCAAPVCPPVVARCSDAKKLRLVAVMRRRAGRALPQPIQLSAGIEESDTSAFVADETGMAWHLRVGDHVGRDDVPGSRDADATDARRVDAISCGTVTLDDGTTITRAQE